MVSTGDFSYGRALKAKITFTTIDGSEELFVYNAFSDSNPVKLTNLDVEGAIGESGTFNILIEDNSGAITDDLHNCKVYIQLGKSESTLHYFMIGFADITVIDRPVTNIKHYALTGFGSAIQASQLFIHRREKYRRDESDAKVYNIIDNALTKRLWRPLKQNDRSIQDITGWSRDGISNKVNTPITVINKPFTYFSDLCNELCDITGATWFIDFTGGQETFTLTYNNALVTPIIIKSGDLMNRTNDDATKTAYIKSGFVVADNSTAEAGTATRLITTTVQDKQRVIEFEDGTGSTTLDFRAIAQQVIIDNDARRLDSIELRLSNDGEPESPNSRVNGDIVLDNANEPTGNILDEFHIPLSSIEDGAEWIEVPVDVSAEKLDVAQSKIWIRLFQRSGLTGDPTHDPSNTIKWHHSNIFNVTQDVRSSQASEGDADKKSSLDWNTTDQGPIYTVRINSNIRRLFSRTNNVAANRLRLKEQFIPTDFLDDPQDVMRFLSLNLSQTSKGRRGIGEFIVTVPNNFIFKPYQFVNMSDGLSGISDVFRVQRVRYTMGQGGGDAQIGSLQANITLSGLYNTLLGNCTCA